MEYLRKTATKDTQIKYVKGCEVIGEGLNEIAKAKDAAAASDIAIVVVGEKGNDTNGEGRDVANLDLTGLQQTLLEEVYSTGTPVIAVLINGRPLSIRWAAEKTMRFLHNAYKRNEVL